MNAFFFIVFIVNMYLSAKEGLEFVKEVEQKVRDFPSLICLSFSMQSNMLAFHGGIRDIHKQHYISKILEASTNEDHKAVMNKCSCESIEWCDYSKSEKKRANSDVRQNVSRKHTDDVLKNVSGVLTVGGHQDQIESMGLVGDTLIRRDSEFRISPRYESETDIYVRKDFCSLDKKNKKCEDINKYMTYSFEASPMNLRILKTSVAYTCKPSVNGTCYITISEKKPSVLEVLVTVFPKRDSVKAIKFTERDGSWDKLNELSFQELGRLLEKLPCIGEDYDKAYKLDGYKTVSKSVLSAMMKMAPDYDTKDCVLFFNVPKNAKVVCVGDIHSNIHGFYDILNELYENGMLNDDFQFSDGIVFLMLGDYGDRGPYGLLVHWLIFRLRKANANPVRFLAIRGNHEDKHMWKGTGMLKEFKKLLR